MALQARVGLGAAEEPPDGRRDEVLIPFALSRHSDCSTRFRLLIDFRNDDRT
jgi:hypothetical protein